MHVSCHHHGPHLRWGGWAKTAPSSHLVTVHRSLPQGVEGIAGPGIDHPCSSSGTRPSFKPRPPEAPTHELQQRAGLSAQTSAPLASDWRLSELCFPTAEQTRCLCEQLNQCVPVSSISLSIPATGLCSLVSDKAGPPWFFPP